MYKPKLSSIFTLTSHTLGWSQTLPFDKTDYVRRRSSFFRENDHLVLADLWKGIGAYTKGQWSKDAALLESIEATDFDGVQNAVESGANLDVKNSPLYKMDGEPLFRALTNAGIYIHDQEANTKIIEYLLEQGAPISLDDLYLTITREPYTETEEQKVVIEEHLNRAKKSMLTASKSYYKAGDYTLLMQDYESSRSEPYVYKLLIDHGANPNDTSTLVNFSNGQRSGGGSYDSLYAAKLPLHNWLSMLLEEDKNVAKNVTEKGHARKVIDTLLDCGAESELILNPKGNYYESNEDYQRLKENPIFSLPVYEVKDEEKELLRAILAERAAENKPKLGQPKL